MRSLLGIFLASGYLTYCRGATKSYVRATFCCGPRDRDFLEEKIVEIRQSVPTKAAITPYQTPERESGKRTTVLRFRFSSNELRPIHNLLHPRGLYGCRDRRITSTVLELLGGRAAAWLWAEGARVDARAAVLSHVGSTAEEARLISGWLRTITGAESQISRAWVKPRLLFSSEQAAQLQQALLPYAPASRRTLFLPAEAI